MHAISLQQCLLFLEKSLMTQWRLLTEAIQAAAFFLMKRADFLCTVPMRWCPLPLAAPSFQTAGGVCSCSAV